VRLEAVSYHQQYRERHQSRPVAIADHPTKLQRDFALSLRFEGGARPGWQGRTRADTSPIFGSFLLSVVEVVLLLQYRVLTTTV
jgi:hypothetical protein